MTRSNPAPKVAPWLVTMEEETAWLRGRLLAQCSAKPRRAWRLAAGLGVAFMLLNAGVLWSKQENGTEGLLCFGDGTPARALEVNRFQTDALYPDGRSNQYNLQPHRNFASCAQPNYGCRRDAVTQRQFGEK